MSSPLFFNKDVGALLQFTIRKPNGDLYDITTATVDLVVENVDSFSCTVVDGPAGRADYTVGANEFNAGTYRAHLKTTIGGTILYTSIFTLRVSQALNSDAIVTPPIIIVDGLTPNDGALIYGDPSGPDFAELAIGPAGRPLISTGTIPSWAALLGVGFGGTNLATYTAGDILYATGSTTLAKLPVGSSGQILTVSAGAPAWTSATFGRGEVNNLAVIQTPGSTASSVTITADAIDIEGNRATAVNVTAALTVSGAGGLDTGAEANNTTYFLWLIRKSSDGTVNGLLSLSATSPTMPATYDQKRLIGHRRNNNSGDMIGQVQCNDMVLGDSAEMQIASAISATADLDMSSFVPAAIADMVLINTLVSNTAEWALDDKDVPGIRYFSHLSGAVNSTRNGWVHKNASNLVTATEVSGTNTFSAWVAGWKVKGL